MRCIWLKKLAGTAVCSGLLTLSGCYSMNGYVMNASGLGYYEQGNYAMAAQEFQNAVASSPRNPDYLANLAKSRMKMGDSAGAEQLFQQALSLSPSHQPSYHGYAELMMTQGRSQDALRMMNTWAATQPYAAESHVELAWVQRELGQHDAAAQSLQSALQVNPSHATALAHLGQYYQDTGNQTQAVAMYQRALQADWNQPEVHSRLASAAQAAGANHPMGETAMARGVHPASVPPQQLAWGAPAPSTQVAGGTTPMMMPPTQMAYQSQMASRPPIAHQQPPQSISPVNFAGNLPQNSTMQGPGAGMGMNSMPGFPMAFGTAGTVGAVSAGDTSMTQPNGNTTPATGTEFSASSADPSSSTTNSATGPFLSVSNSAETTDEAPEVEAF